MDDKPLTTARAVGEAVLALPKEKPDAQMSRITALIAEIESRPGGFSFRSQEAPAPEGVKAILDWCIKHEILVTDGAALISGAAGSCLPILVQMCAALKVMSDRKDQAVTFRDVIETFIGFPSHKDFHDLWDQRIDVIALADPEAWR
jgi:hypothetical protein